MRTKRSLRIEERERVSVVVAVVVCSVLTFVTVSLNEITILKNMHERWRQGNKALSVAFG